MRLCGGGRWSYRAERGFVRQGLADRCVGAAARTRARAAEAVAVRPQPKPSSWMDIMNLRSLRRALEPVGWRQDADALVSPSGGVWLTEADLEPSGMCALYASAARRAEQARRFEHHGSFTEYRDLTRALASHPHVRGMLALHDAVRQVFEPWAQRHGMTLRDWDFGRSSIRAEARHPEGGVACVEWICEAPTPPVLYSYHWIDDPSHSVRLSWRTAAEARSAESGALLQQLEEAVERLRERREPAVYTSSLLAVIPGVDSSDDDRALEVLR